MKQLLHIFCVTVTLLVGMVYAQGPAPGFIWPTSGEVTSTVHSAERPSHGGVDIANDVGTPILAAASGTVVSAGDSGGPGGTEIVIEHPDGTATIYSHLSGMNVKVGDTVQQGNVIGAMGSTGRSSGPHLHFEIRDASNNTLQVNGQEWDNAAGVQNGQMITAGASTPGGPTTNPGGDPNNPANGTPPAGGTTNAGGSATGPPALPPSPFDPTKVDLDTVLPSPQKWIDATTAIITKFGLAKHLNTLGFVLLFAGFVYGLVNATYFYRTDQYYSLFGRLIIAAGLIWGSPAIAKSGLNMWTSIHNNMQEAVTSEAITELEGHINTFAPIVKDWAVATGLLTALAAVAPEPFGIDVISPIKDMSKDFTRGLFTITVLLGSIYGIFLLSIYVSMLMMLLAGMLLPVLAAFLVLPGMISWFSRWFSMVVLSLAIIIILPFMLHVVVTVGISEPVQTLSTIAEGAGKQIIWLQEKAQRENPGFTPKIWEYGTYMASMTTAMLQVSANLVQIFIRWVFGLVILAIGILASVYILQQIPRLLASLIGGVAGSAPSAVSGSAIAGLAIGGATAIAGGQAAGALGSAAGAAAAKTASMAPMAMRPTTQPGGSRPALPAGGGSSGSSSGSSSGNSSSGNSSGSSGGGSSGSSSSSGQTIEMKEVSKGHYKMK